MALLLARSLLAVVFMIAAVGKLCSREGFRETLSDFGLPHRLTGLGAAGLPLAELAVAALLLSPGSARVGALAALGLLVLFCAAIARALVRGEHPDCNCFGQVHSAPVRGVLLARNAGFAAVAGLVAAAGPGRGVGSVVNGIDVTPVGAVLALVSLAFLLLGFSGWQLFRQNGRLLERVRALEESANALDGHSLSGLPVGQPAPDFELDDLHGGRRSLADLLAPGLPVALVFSDPDCDACADLAPRLGRLREESGGSLEIAVISRGTRAENLARQGGALLEHVLLQHDREAFAAYRVHTVPSATIVDADGRVASETVTGNQAIERLIGATAVPVPERLRVAAG
jgi:peroxiredoxin